ncbi:hypothetical protein EXU30_03195 [Shewanella maritima]|uniref:Flagellar hook-length control protein-like C-terminal domain-containing protein n=2 Tax=Shewanella maritima TaxID=2520507 RepID=A0A411PMK6_9GAMM|nr:hypothetical protein EXU30_03195 [Shewanella maritima]
MLESGKDAEGGAQFIFAQRELGENLKLVEGDSGKTLPLADEFAQNALQSTKDAKKQSQISATSAESANEGDLFTSGLPAVKASVNGVGAQSQTQATSDYLTTLNFSQLQELMAFSGHSREALNKLSSAELSQLVDDFNLQAPVVDESILAMAELDLDAPTTNVNLQGEARYAVHGLGQQVASESKTADTTKFTSELSSDIEAELESQWADKSKAVDTILPIDNSKLTNNTTAASSEAAASKSDKAVLDMLDELLPQADTGSTKKIDKRADIAELSATQTKGAQLNAEFADKLNQSLQQNKSTADQVSLSNVAKNLQAGNILGDQDSVAGKISANIDDAAKAIDKSLDKVAADKAQLSANQSAAVTNGLNEKLQASNAAAMDFAGIELDIADSVDTKAVQNQSSFTPIHKSDVPQFQLSLRTASDTNVQMQEMIQRFAPVMKQQLVAMVSNGVQQAEIRLDPPELGSMMVKVQVQGDQTQVQFQAAQQQTRDVLEQAMPRLREMLAQEGMQLTDGNVSEQGQQQRGDAGDGDAHGGQFAQNEQSDEIAATEASSGQNTASSSHSAIDYYA